MGKRRILGFASKKVFLCSTAIILSYSVEMLELKKLAFHFSPNELKIIQEGKILLNLLYILTAVESYRSNRLIKKKFNQRCGCACVFEHLLKIIEKQKHNQIMTLFLFNLSYPHI